jgi:hypothetical protein
MCFPSAAPPVLELELDQKNSGDIFVQLGHRIFVHHQRIVRVPSNFTPQASCQATLLQEQQFSKHNHHAEPSELAPANEPFLWCQEKCPL